MIIELLGVPACGKSTYVKMYSMKNNVIAPLDMYLYNASRLKQNMNKIKLIIYAFLYKRYEFLKYNHLINKINFQSFNKRMKLWLYLFSILGAKWKAENRFPKHTIILDEGINQVIWGILYNEQDSIEAVWTLQKELLTEMGEKIVYLKVSESVLDKRLKSRRSNGGSELEHDIKKNTTILKKSIHLVDEIIEHLNMYGVHIYIENNQ